MRQIVRVLYQFRVFVILLLVSLADAQTGQIPVAVLTVALRDSLGLQMPGGKLLIRNGEGKSIFSEVAQDTATVRLPYGRYTVSFETPFFQRVVREIDISRPEPFLVLGAEMDRFVLDGKNDPVAVSVSVTPSSSCRPDGLVWAKIIGVFSTNSFEQRIKPAGSVGVALFEPMEVGTYLIVVIDGSIVRATTFIETKKPLTVVSLSLSPCPPSSQTP